MMRGGPLCHKVRPCPSHAARVWHSSWVVCRMLSLADQAGLLQRAPASNIASVDRFVLSVLVQLLHHAAAAGSGIEGS